MSGPLEAPLAELLSVAREDTARLRALVEDLLDLSRIQRGRVQLALEELPAAALLEEVVAGARAAAQAGQIKLEVDFSTPELRIIADPPRLRLALGNLVQNAIRHAPAGTEVYCRVRSSGSAARFEVDDAGPGVRPEDRARIFEPFVRGEDEAPGGAGLGLSIAAEIVAAHGGSIGVGEAELGGARFWIELPAANALTIRAEASAEVSARP